MELKVPETVLIEKLREMIRREEDSELIAIYMQQIAELQRQRRKNILKENSVMLVARNIG
jgi:hypothetical protein